jgi:Helix-turn-helix domain of transposase family ISL3
MSLITDPKKRYTRAFERYALELSRYMTIQDVAEHLYVRETIAPQPVC